MGNLRILNNFSKKMLLRIDSVLVGGILIFTFATGCASEEVKANYNTAVVYNDLYYDIKELYVVIDNNTGKQYVCYDELVDSDTKLSSGVVISTIGDGPFALGTNGFGYSIGGINFNQNTTNYFGYYNIFNGEIVTLSKEHDDSSIDEYYTIKPYLEWSQIDLYEGDKQNEIIDEIDEIVNPSYQKKLN